MKKRMGLNIILTTFISLFSRLIGGVSFGETLIMVIIVSIGVEMLLEK